MRRPHRARTTLTALSLLLSLGLSWVAPSTVWAGAPTDAMRDFFGAVNVVLTDPRTDDQPLERLRAIRRHVDDVFDFREAAMLALGREWPARTALEQNEFVALFADLLERSFVWRVAGKAALGGGVKVQYVSETVEGDIATVETAVAARDGNDLKLDYRMVRRADRWVVRDVVMDGVSTMENYHAQFQRVVRDSSWKDLLGQLRAKVGAPAVQVAAAATVPSPVPRPAALVADPPAPPDLDRPVAEERQTINRDVAAVVTPGLAVRDVTPLSPIRQLAPISATPDRRVAPAPAPIAAAPSPVRPTSVSDVPLAALGAVETSRTSRMGEIERVAAPEPPRAAQAPEAQRVETAPPARTPRANEAVGLSPRASAKVAALPAIPAERPRGIKPAVARGAETAPAYWVQVGAFRNAVMAGRVAERVRGEILIVHSPAASGPLLRVRVGPFTTRAQAASRLREFQTLGYQPFIAAD